MSAAPPIWKAPALPTSPGAHDNEVRDYLSIGPAAVARVVQALGISAPPEPPVLAVLVEEAEPARRMTKLTRTMMRSWVARHLSTKQGNLCPLCKKYIDLKVKGEGVVDHDHDTGEIRGVLHRSCNAAEGKISNAAARWGAKSSSYTAIIAYLTAMVEYLRSPGTGMIYPMHKTADEKADDRKAKAKLARAANKAKLLLRSRKT